MLIECETCPVAQRGCDDCAVGALLGMPAPWRERGRHARLDAAERRAVNAFVAAGLLSVEDSVDLFAVVDDGAIAV